MIKTNTNQRNAAFSQVKTTLDYDKTDKLTMKTYLLCSRSKTKDDNSHVFACKIQKDHFIPHNTSSHKIKALFILNTNEATWEKSPCYCNYVGLNFYLFIIDKKSSPSDWIVSSTFYIFSFPIQTMHQSMCFCFKSLCLSLTKFFVLMCLACLSIL